MTTYSTRTWNSICYEADKSMFDPEEGYRFDPFKTNRVFLNPGVKNEYLTTDDTPYKVTDGTPYYVSG